MKRVEKVSVRVSNARFESKGFIRPRNATGQAGHYALLATEKGLHCQKVKSQKSHFALRIHKEALRLATRDTGKATTNTTVPGTIR